MNRLLAAIALAAFLGAMVAIAVSSGTPGGTDSKTVTTAATTRRSITATAPPTTTRSTPRKPVPVKLTGVGAFDPEGDGHENGDLAPLAVDGDRATFWKTERYRNFSKRGVGLLLDAGRRRPIGRVVLRSDTPGFSAQIQIGDDPKGPFPITSADKGVNRVGTFFLKKGTAGRYVLVWITSLPPDGEAHVNEVLAERIPG